MVKKALPLLPAALVLLAFSPALNNGFVSWDDPGNIVRNPWLGTAAAWLESFTSTHYGHFQPLAWLSLSLDKLVWGLDPFGYHLTALLLHAASAVVLALLLRDVTSGSGTDVTSAAVLAASLWAVHPLRVEAVAWATERRELLATLFLLLSMRAYAGGGRQTSFLFFTAAALSKVTATVFPFVLIAFDHWRGDRLRMKEKAPFFLVSFAILALGVRAQYLSGTAVPLEAFGVIERLSQALFAPGWYAWKTLWPVGLSPFVYVDARAEGARFYPFAVLSVLLSVSLWFSRRRRSAVPLSAAVLLFLAPSMGFFKSGPQTAADRFVHMASLPLAVAAAFALARSARARLAAGLALLAFVPLTRAQNAVWKDSIALWTRAYESVPRPTPLVVQNLAAALREGGREDEAAALFARLASEAPESPAAYAVRGDAAFEGGDLAAAESLYAQALARNADLPQVRVNRGLALYRLGRHAEAEAEFARAAGQDPLSADAWHNLGLCRARRGDRAAADEALGRALKLSPGRPDTLRVRALLREAK